MCGIAGRFNFDRGAPVDRAPLVAMTDAVAHRGPDAAGYYLDGGIGLGHRRLSIIDLATGDQPLGNEDGSIQVVFNGEIYNFAEVRAELLAHGHRFRTDSDTEVIVHGYEQWGERCVDRFRGMFAFAVWDAQRAPAAARARSARRQAALLRRDARAGWCSDRRSSRCSRIREVPRDWRADALDAYLTLLYIPAPDTIYRGIHKLPPAHVLVAERGHGPHLAVLGSRVHRRRRRARAKRSTSRSSTRTLREAVQLRHDQRRAARRVPLRRHRLVARSWPTWSRPATSRRSPSRSASTTRRFDEVAHAETVARHLGCEFHALTASPRVEELLPKLAWHFDEPFADSSAVPTYYVSKAARELVTVALSGDGGDELWAGYARHRVEHWEQRVARRARARRACRRLARPGAAALGQGGAVAAAPRRGSRSGLRAQARLRHVRAGREERGSIPATSADSVNGYDAFAAFRDAYHALRLAAIRSTARCTSTPAPT